LTVDGKLRIPAKLPKKAFKARLNMPSNISSEITIVAKVWVQLSRTLQFTLNGLNTSAFPKS